MEVMPRLKVHDGPQQGVATGATRVHGDTPKRKKRKKEELPEQPLGADRASRARSGDSTMDGDKFAEMLTEEVFPAIRSKLADAKMVTVQWDNAGGHGIKSLMTKIEAELPAPFRRGEQVGPESVCVPSAHRAPRRMGATSASTSPWIVGCLASTPSTLRTRSSRHGNWDGYPSEKLDDLTST